MLAQLQSFDLARFESPRWNGGEEGDAHSSLADVLDEIAFTTATLSDRLAMRYFTHVGDVGRQTLAA